LGNRIQHALRAFTARDQKAVRAAAQTFRANPAFDTESAITELGVGEALISTLDAQGAPTIVERTLLRPPSSHLGPATAEQRSAAMAASPFADRYEIALDRHSAYEQLAARAEAAAESRNAAKSPARRRETPLETMTKSALRSVGSQIGREIARGVLGSLFRGR
jgi:hypothetical protein